MTSNNKVPEKACDLGRAFFHEVVRPAMEDICPHLLSQAACGRFGVGSECLGLDDAFSRDHHWGPRVDILLPEKVFTEQGQDIYSKISERFPEEFRGFKLEAGLVGGSGLAPQSIESFLMSTVGLTKAPQSSREWLDIPEEDIIHVINGEVWHDGSGDFTRLRRTYQAYYPEPVWKRRIAHWCRYCSGMGLYPMRRALLRNNLCYAYTALARTLKLTLELTFLLNRTYFPYDKWLYPTFQKLPRLAGELDPLIYEVTRPETPWSGRVELFEAMHDLLDADMVAQGIIRPHPKFQKSETSGYRLLEHAYAELCRELPPNLLQSIPQWNQIYFEMFHANSVAGLPEEDWHRALDLKPLG